MQSHGVTTGVFAPERHCEKHGRVDPADRVMWSATPTPRCVQRGHRICVRRVCVCGFGVAVYMGRVEEEVVEGHAHTHGPEHKQNLDHTMISHNMHVPGKSA